MTRKHSVLVIAALAVATGCATSVKTGFSESITDPVTGEVETTKYEAISKAGPFGELDTTSHNFGYRYGEGEPQNEISTGQEARGVSNAGQIEALKSALPVLQAVIDSAIRAAAVGGVARPSPDAAVGDQSIDAIRQAAIDRLVQWITQNAPDAVVEVAGQITGLGAEELLRVLSGVAKAHGFAAAP